MKKTFSRKKSAFSLIELSIVLIIIGLLVAGITGGASLIKSSELRSVMGEARAYAVSVNAFYTQFNAYPGDYGTNIGGVSASSTVAAYGDADGTIEYYSSATPSGGTKSESSAAWIHLRYAGMIDNLPATIALTEATTAPVFGTASSTNSPTAPSSKTKNNGWAFDYRTATEGNSTAANQNTVVLSGTIGTSVTAGTATLLVGTNVATASLIGSDALSIDAKIDDGYANLGKVRGVNPGSSSSCYTASTSAAANYVTTSSSTKVCALSFQIDTNS